MKDDHDYRTLKMQINFDLGTIFDKRESRIQIQKGMKIKNLFSIKVWTVTTTIYSC